MNRNHSFPLVLATMVAVTVALAAAVSLTSAAPESSPKIEEIEYLRHAGWKLPRPPYPLQARMHHELGVVYVRMTTNAKGIIIKVAVPAQPKSVESEVLRSSSLSYAIHNWSGPPNSTAITKLDYRLQ